MALASEIYSIDTQAQGAAVQMIVFTRLNICLFCGALIDPVALAAGAS